MENTPLSFLHEIEKIKHLPRTGWLRTIPHPETVAAHTFRVAMLAFLAPSSMNLDKSKCIQMALFHDLGESVIGDIPTFAGVPKDEKYKLERNSIEYLAILLQKYSPDKAAEIRDLWLEYEEGESPEAQWVRQMDKFECLMQACEYEQRTYGEEDLTEFQGQSSKIVSPEAASWLTSLQDERRVHLSRRKQRLPIVFLTGNPLASENVSERISKIFHFPCISVDKILNGKAEDPSEPLSEFVRNCQIQGHDLPVGLIVHFLEEEIKKVPETSARILISGFPKTIEQIEEFERKVQKSSDTLWLAYEHDSRDRELSLEAKSKFECWKSAVDLKEYLKESTPHFSELTGTDEELEELTKKSFATSTYLH